MEYLDTEKTIATGIGLGVFLLITTYLLAIVLFGRLMGFVLILFLGEIVIVAGLLTIFFRRRYQVSTLAVPIAAGILFTIITVGVAIFIGTTLIHAPLPPPDSPAWSSGNRVIAMAVSIDEISTTSLEAKELLLKGLGIASRNNEFETAIGYYDQALAIDPSFSEAWMAKGVALHNLGSYAEAVDCIDRALAIDPSNPAAWSLKGNILESWGQPDEAAACYRKAGELDSRYQPTPPIMSNQ
ncbi:MAG TPA: tetratricopeptide repeat protein [Methanoregulaceae archaeon]|nr:tetratricopeptide repeat protein [Methanoregulaceae archaeon]